MLRNQVGTGIGLYYGLTIKIGVGFGPAVFGGIASVTGNYTLGIMSLAVLCAIGESLMFFLGWLIKYQKNSTAKSVT